MASMFRFRIPPTVLLVLIVGRTSCIYVFFGLYLLIALIALNLACLLWIPDREAARMGRRRAVHETSHLSPVRRRKSQSQLGMSPNVPQGKRNDCFRASPGLAVKSVRPCNCWEFHVSR